MVVSRKTHYDMAENDPDRLKGPGGLTLREIHEQVRKSVERDRGPENEKRAGAKAEPLAALRALRLGAKRKALGGRGEVAYHALEPLHHAREPVVVELVRCVAQRVVVRVAEWRGVGHHHRGPAEIPVSPL